MKPQVKRRAHNWHALKPKSELASMSNRDGKNSKLRKSKTIFRVGSKCKNCLKGKLQRSDCCKEKGHENHVYCSKCKFTNF